MERAQPGIPQGAVDVEGRGLKRTGGGESSWETELAGQPNGKARGWGVGEVSGYKCP